MSAPSFSSHPAVKYALRRSQRLRLQPHLPLDSRPVLDALRTRLARTRPGTLIAAYAALPDEIDLSPLVSEFPDVHWLLPVIGESEMTFHPWESSSMPLQPGKFSILEPPADSPAAPIPNIDVFLCPGRGFDPTGARLGRGGGYYDRALANASPSARFIGIAHPEMRIENAFPEPHDIRMHEVIG